MYVNQDLAEFSDLAYKTAVALYLVSLAVSLVYYGMLRSATEARRERSRLVNPLENYKRQRRAFRSSRLRLGHCTNLSLG
jgi:hypothetical protein